MNGITNVEQDLRDTSFNVFFNLTLYKRGTMSHNQSSGPKAMGYPILMTSFGRVPEPTLDRRFFMKEFKNYKHCNFYTLHFSISVVFPLSVSFHSFTFTVYNCRSGGCNVGLRKLVGCLFMII